MNEQIPPTPPAPPAPLDEARVSSMIADALAKHQPAAAKTDDEFKATMISRARNAKLDTFARAAGVNPDYVDAFIREFNHHHAAGLKYDFATDALSFTNAAGAGQKIDETMAAFLGTKHGAIYKAASTDTAPDAATNSKPFYSQLSPAEREKLTPAERAAYLQEDLKRGKR